MNWKTYALCLLTTMLAPAVYADSLTETAIGEGSEALAARRALRAQGPAGLVALLRDHATAVSALRRGQRGHDGLRAAIDHVSGQRDGHASGLFWYTDLERAKAAAQELNRPILSLRLLGRLDEEMSCANSRMFRLLLYPDSRVRQVLARQYVLHWSSERRHAPRITIDLGDGRRIERTITGNSIHYVLNHEGRPITAIPGLYTPDGFVRAAEEAHAMWSRCDDPQCVRGAHASTMRSLAGRWNRMRTPSAPQFSALPTGGATTGATVPAAEALPVAVTKSGFELPLLGALQPTQATPPAWAAWAPLPVLRVDSRVRGLLRLKLGEANTERFENRLQRLVGEDELQNEFALGRRIHQRLAEASPSFEELNAWVYRDIFLTPASDPWLGLRDDDLFDGIERLN